MLRHAAYNGHLQIVQELLKRGANIEAKDKVGQAMKAGCMCGGVGCGLGLVSDAVNFEL